MPRYMTSPNVELSLKRRPRESAHERRDRYRGELKITTAEVTEELRKRWHGAPPSRVDLKRRPGTLSF